MDTKKLRQKILDLAIRGKLVPQDPNEEPASVLLERIKAEKERLIKEGKIKRSKKAAKTSDTPHYKNVPFEVPDNWIWTTVEEILELVSGQDFPPEKYNNNVSGVPYIIGASNIENEQLVINRWTEFPSVFSYINDLLVVCKGAGVGKMAVNNIGTAHIARQIQAVRAYTNYINIKYIKAVVKHNIEDIISKANGLIPGLKRELLLSLQIPLPPFSEQQRIIIEMEHLFTLIDKVEENKYDLQSIIKQAKNKILALAIHGKLVPQDLNDEPASELVKRINPKAEITCDNAHYTNLPAGWAMCKLSDLCKIENGFAFSSDDYKSHGIPLVRISNITHNTIDITDCAYIEGITDAKFKVSKGDLLIAMSGATTGKMGVYPFDETAYLNQRVGNIKILNKSSLYPNYRNTYMQSKVDEILKIAYGGAQPNISASIIGNFDFPLPPYKEQIRIVETVQRIFDQLDVITESL